MEEDLYQLLSGINDVLSEHGYLWLADIRQKVGN